MLINYVAPEVIGFTNGVNQFVADYVKEDPQALIVLRQPASQAHDERIGRRGADSAAGNADDQDPSAAPVVISE